MQHLDRRLEHFDEFEQAESASLPARNAALIFEDRAAFKERGNAMPTWFATICDKRPNPAARAG